MSTKKIRIPTLKRVIDIEAELKRQDMNTQELRKVAIDISRHVDEVLTIETQRAEAHRTRMSEDSYDQSERIDAAKLSAETCETLVRLQREELNVTRNTISTLCGRVRTLERQLCDHAFVVTQVEQVGLGTYDVHEKCVNCGQERTREMGKLRSLICHMLGVFPDVR